MFTIATANPFPNKDIKLLNQKQVDKYRPVFPYWRDSRGTVAILKDLLDAPLLVVQDHRLCFVWYSRESAAEAAALLNAKYKSKFQVKPIHS